MKKAFFQLVLTAGMILQPGQSITIQASGECKLSEGEISSGPAGIESMDTHSVLPSAPLGSLIGRIEGGQPFEIGTRTTVS